MNTEFNVPFLLSLCFSSSSFDRDQRNTLGIILGKVKLFRHPLWNVGYHNKTVKATERNAVRLIEVYEATVYLSHRPPL